VIIDLPTWRDDAACQYTDPEAFFPEKGESVAMAKRVCSRCPVRTPCLDYALETRQRHGVWGGLSEPERRRLATEQSLAVAS
jgi:WhiB family redox-sensing transcriptional regulator